jgi:hypothetical protein
MSIYLLSLLQLGWIKASLFVANFPGEIKGLYTQRKLSPLLNDINKARLRLLSKSIIEQEGDS